MKPTEGILAFLSGCALTVFLLILAVSYLKSHPPSIENETYAEKACAQQHPEYSRPKIGWLTYQKKSSRHHPAKASDKNNIAEKPDWCDLAAQESMAQSTASIESATWLMTIFTFFGVGAIFFTLKYTKRTLDEAHKTVEVTREIGEAQARSYLSVVGADVTVAKDGMIVDVSVKNTGQTPTATFEYEWGASAHFSEERRKGEEIAKGGASGSHENIGSNTTATRRSFGANGGIEQKAIRNARDINQIYVRIYVAWVDVFGADHIIFVKMNGPIEWGEDDLGRGSLNVTYSRIEKEKYRKGILDEYLSNRYKKMVSAGPMNS